METNLRIFLSLPRQLLMRVLLFLTPMLLLKYITLHYITYQTKQKILSEFNSELENYLKIDHKDLWLKL